MTLASALAVNVKSLYTLWKRQSQSLYSSFEKMPVSVSGKVYSQLWPQVLTVKSTRVTQSCFKDPFQTCCKTYTFTLLWMIICVRYGFSTKVSIYSSHIFSEEHFPPLLKSFTAEHKMSMCAGGSKFPRTLV